MSKTGSRSLAVQRRRPRRDARPAPPPARAASGSAAPASSQSRTSAGTDARRAQALEPLVAHPLRGELGQSGRPPPPPPSRSRARWRSRTARRSAGRGGSGGSPRGIARPASPTARSSCRVEVVPPAERVAPLVPQRMVGDGVDGEVAAGEILVQRDAVGHDGVAAVGGDVAAEGGHLVQHAPAVEHADGAVLLAHRRRAAEQRGHLCRRAPRWRNRSPRAAGRGARRAARRPRTRPRGPASSSVRAISSTSSGIARRAERAHRAP